MRDDFLGHLTIQLDDPQLIQANAYCRIFRCRSGQGPVIVKHYREDSRHLIVAEAQALSTYHRLVDGDTRWLDCRPIELASSANLLVIAFVPGQRLSDLIYQGRWQPECRQRVLTTMHRLGQLLGEFQRQTSQSQPASPFLAEYIEYCSQRLDQMPIVGKIMFGNEVDSAKSFIDDLRSCGHQIGFAHGDFVPRNIHVTANRVGLVDFANSNHHSHLANDLANFHFALANMRIRSDYRHEIRQALLSRLGATDIPAAIWRFYYEYHRRRWLFLKLSAHNPMEWLQFLRGYYRFARPYRQGLNCGLAGDSRIGLP